MAILHVTPRKSHSGGMGKKFVHWWKEVIRNCSFIHSFIDVPHVALNYIGYRLPEVFQTRNVARPGSDMPGHARAARGTYDAIVL